MSSWGATDADESKPKFLTDAEKKLVFANTSGWVLEAGSAFSGNDNTSATPEVLVAIGDLTTSLGNADITDVELPTSYSKGTGGNFDVTVRFNEAVDVTGNPTILITNNTSSSRNQTATYVSGTGTNELIFRKANAAATLNASDVLKVVAASPYIALSGGTVKDEGTNTASSLNIAASIATASGTLTVAA